MTDNKLTDVTDNNVGKMNDNEIINNIVWCMNPNNACADCPYYELRASLNCVSSLFVDTLDLINRLQAENERLIIRLRKVEHQLDDAMKMYNIIKAEAYKEFAEKIKDNTREFGSANGVQREVDNLLKELVGDK